MANKSHALNQFPDTTFILSTTTLEAKELASVYEIQVTDWITMRQEGEEPLSDAKEWFKELKDKS